MKFITTLAFISIQFLSIGVQSIKANPLTGSLTVFEADNPNFKYTGRIDFSDVKKPRFWSPGVYIKAKFKGSYCELLVNDQELWGKNHNYL